MQVGRQVGKSVGRQACLKCLCARVLIYVHVVEVCGSFRKIGGPNIVP